jgi:hypothetical protein
VRSFDYPNPVHLNRFVVMCCLRKHRLYYDSSGPQ